ncbi:MAG TPA: hypothetical protein VFA12_20170 [Stellaceae bacterium]|nr:hypothetical protein [Stellaceae bacterium]
MRTKSTVAGELLALASQINTGDKLQAQQVVDWARSHPKSALYAALCPLGTDGKWDLVKAAEEYLLHQARRLIAVHIVDEAGARKVVSLSVDRVSGGGYRRVKDVLMDVELTAVMLKDALAELQRVRLKYETVQALAGVWRELDRVKEQYRNEDAA